MIDPTTTAAWIEPDAPIHLSFVVAVRTATESNAKGNWRPRAANARRQRQIVATAIQGACPLPPLPAVIQMVRLAPRELDDDNLASAMKHVRDQIAAAYRVDDRSKLYRWLVDQEKAKDYAVRIEIESRTP